MHVARLTEGLCGAARPVHFDGVTTVVAKLFSIVGPSIAFFGRKDYQQLAVIRQMTADLDLPVEVRGCPLVREPDGVAMSSRNAYLSDERGGPRPVLSQALQAAATPPATVNAAPRAIETTVRSIVGDQPLVALEYAEVRDARTLEPVTRLVGEVVLAVAAKVGRARLIDNVVLRVDGSRVEVDLGVPAGERDPVGSVTSRQWPTSSFWAVASPGLSAAIHAARRGLSVVVLTKGELALSATRYAQGGVAAALEEPDSAELHLSDTLAAGAGLCDPDAVRVLVTEGPDRVRDLMALGAVFDRTGDGTTAALALAREGGHSVPRVVHAGGDATGAEIERALVAAVHALDLVDVRERCFAVDLIVEGGRCVGVRALDPAGAPMEIRARDTIVATGGAGQLFAVTTNPVGVHRRRDRARPARRRGRGHRVHAVPPDRAAPPVDAPAAAVGSAPGRRRGAARRARRRVHGRRAPARRSRAPRCRGRAIARRLVDRGLDHLWLDATTIDDFPERFPTIWRSAQSVGLDPRRDWLPVAPAAHYLCGGVATDLDGASTLPGLWSCGEAACSGVHGANRLASNSLLDGLVFAPRAVDAIVAGKDGPEATGVLRRAVRRRDRSSVPGRRSADRPVDRARRAPARDDRGCRRAATAESLQAVLDALPIDVAAHDPAATSCATCWTVGGPRHRRARARSRAARTRGSTSRDPSNDLLGRFFQLDDALTFHPLPVDVRQPSA